MPFLIACFCCGTKEHRPEQKHCHNRSAKHRDWQGLLRIPNEYTSAALDIPPCCRSSGAMCVIVPVNSWCNPFLGECSGRRRLRPKSETFAVNPLGSACSADLISADNIACRSQLVWWLKHCARLILSQLKGAGSVCSTMT